jgi:hypothetical protein
MNADLDQNVIWRLFDVLDIDIEVLVLIEDARIDEFVLKLFSVAFLAGLHEVVVRVGRLRILVQVLHVRVRRSAIQVEVILFDIFAVVAFAVGQAEQTFFQDGVFAIPESECKTEMLLVIGDTCQAIFTPAVSTGACLIVREIIPGIATFTVIFTNGTPLPFAEVRAPLLP